MAILNAKKHFLIEHSIAVNNKHFTSPKLCSVFKGNLRTMIMIYYSLRLKVIPIGLIILFLNFFFWLVFVLKLIILF